MASKRAAGTLLLTLHLVQSLLVWGAHLNDTGNGPNILVRPPELEKIKAKINFRLPKYLSPLHLPPGPSGSCHVDIGGHSFYTVGGGGYSTGIPAPPPPPPPPSPSPSPKRRLQAAPRRSYIWLELGAVEVWDAGDLVTAINNQNSSIIVSTDIDVSGVVPLPEITYRVVIMGVCYGGWYCKLDAKSQGTIFEVGLGGDLTLKDLDLRNGWGIQGGAVLVSGSNATDYSDVGKFVALNVDFYNNSASQSGGAIAAIGGGVAYYSGCIYYLNSAPKGGAIYIGGSDPLPQEGEDVTETTLESGNGTRVTTLDYEWLHSGCGLPSCSSFVDSLFFINWANDGGAVYIDDAGAFCGEFTTGFFSADGARIDIKNTHFLNNTAIFGGAMYNAHNNSGTWTQIQDSNFTQNIATDMGGDIMLQEGLQDGPMFVAFRTQFTGTVDSMPQGVFIEPHTFGAFVDCTVTDLTNTINCTGDCYFCPPHDRQKTARTTLADVRLELRRRTGVHSPWAAVEDNECPQSCAPNFCGYVPDECSPPPPPSPPPTPPPPLPPI